MGLPPKQVRIGIPGQEILPINSASNQWLDANIYRVEQYGAIGNGVTDDTAAIQAALNAAGAVGGGIVRLGAHTYAIGSQLEVPPKITVEGLGAGGVDGVAPSRLVALAGFPANTAMLYLPCQLIGGVPQANTGLGGVRNLDLICTGIADFGIKLAGRYWADIINVGVQSAKTDGIYGTSHGGAVNTRLTHLHRCRVLYSLHCGVQMDSGGWETWMSDCDVGCNGWDGVFIKEVGGWFVNCASFWNGYRDWHFYFTGSVVMHGCTSERPEYEGLILHEVGSASVSSFFCSSPSHVGANAASAIRLIGTCGPCNIQGSIMGTTTPKAAVEEDGGGSYSNCHYDLAVSSIFGTAVTLLQGGTAIIHNSGVSTAYGSRGDQPNTPALIGANQNNYDPGSVTIHRISSSAEYAITGLVGGISGRYREFQNVGSNPIVFVHESAASAAGNRLALEQGWEIVLQPGDIIRFRYDSTVSRWRLVFYQPTTALILVGLPLTNLVSWWEADKLQLMQGLVHGSTVSSITDLSGNGNHFIQVAGTSQPLLWMARQNSLPSLHFDGANDLVTCDALGAIFTGDDIPLSVYVVLKSETFAAARAFFSLGNSGTDPNSRHEYFGNVGPTWQGWRYDDTGMGGGEVNLIVADQWGVFNGIYTGADRNMWFNGGDNGINATALGVTTFNQCTIGARRRATVDLYFQGEIAAFLLYTASHDAATRSRVRRYLARKYALILPGVS